MNKRPKQKKKKHKNLTSIQSNVRNDQFHSSAYKFNIETNSNKIREH